LAHPDGVALRVFIEQAKGLGWCEVFGHGRLPYLESMRGGKRSCL
jgi:hypothetical protein